MTAPYNIGDTVELQIIKYRGEYSGPRWDFNYDRSLKLECCLLKYVTCQVIRADLFQFVIEHDGGEWIWPQEILLHREGWPTVIDFEDNWVDDFEWE